MEPNVRGNYIRLISYFEELENIFKISLKQNVNKWKSRSHVFIHYNNMRQQKTQ